MMPKRPSFQFYPSDWLRDTALRSCSTGARGLWIDMICYMHEGNPYGHMKVGEKVILAGNLARMVGETLDAVEGWLEELKEAGVYDLTSEGVIFSRRMIRDENLRQIRASGGKLGGNPALKDKSKVNLKVIQEDNQNPTPSSSSSSSSSSFKDKSIVSADADFERFWQVWPVSQRKVAKAKCLDIWKRRKLSEVGEKIVAHVAAMKTTKQWLDGFEPAPVTYLNQNRWEDEMPAVAKPTAVPDWAPKRVTGA
jgi:hypothetical protein